MNDELTKQQIDAILKALDDAIQQGPWGASSFLRVIGKSLLEIREGIAKRVDASAQQQSNRLSSLANQMALRSAQRKVYILLYSFEGSNIKTWERIVANLPRQMISRPVYSQEDDAIAVIKTKENKNNEAYIVIYINENDILPMPTDKLPHDKLGKQLLTLKDKSLKLDNIDCFVHQSGVYHYTQGRLVKDS
jgi:intracellular multiplication protein IcmQ